MPSPNPPRNQPQRCRTSQRSSPQRRHQAHPRAHHPPRSHQRNSHRRDTSPQAHHQLVQNQENAKGKANINIASLNVNRATASREGMSLIEKWASINRMIYNEKITVLALQETHLDQERLDQIQACFSKNLEIINSPLPENPRASAGVAFVINKALIRPKETTVKVLLPGRAIMLKIKWLESCSSSIINIYAPHNRRLQPEFWAEATANRRTLRMPLPDFVLGDFNVTEDAIDHVPAHHDLQIATEAIRDVRREWNIQDTWRLTHPDTRTFTYHANTNNAQIQSRLDRIYTTPEVAQQVFDWQIKPSGVPTDHWLVKVKFAPSDAPFIGNGHWSWPHQQNMSALEAS